MIYDFSINLMKSSEEGGTIEFYWLWKTTKMGITMFFRGKPRIILNTIPLEEQALKLNVTVEKLACMTISHEVMHVILKEQVGFSENQKWDNISESLMEYGVW